MILTDYLFSDVIFGAFRIPQLLTCLKSKIGDRIMNILLQIGKVYPQALYFPIRTLYLTLKIEHREKCKWFDVSCLVFSSFSKYFKFIEEPRTIWEDLGRVSFPSHGLAVTNILIKKKEGNTKESGLLFYLYDNFSNDSLTES